jgi:acetolactate synthase I/II/III large subunit
MNGAESLIRTALACGSDVCFSNPGTTELQLVNALDTVPGMRTVLGLFEGVCTGAADGYGRMADRPALTLLHLGPGLANGLANLHNARRAFTPIVNLIGDHPTWHRASDPPLASDIEGLARPMSSWVRTAASAGALAGDTAAAIAAARSAPGGVATLVVPADCAWDAAAGPAAPQAPARPAPVAASALADAAAALASGETCALLLGHRALRGPGLAQAGRIAAATGARLLCDTFVSRIERGPDQPRVDKLPYFPEQVREVLEKIPRLILVGARAPIAFFGYRGGQSELVPASCRVHALAGPADDVEGALEALAERVGADRSARALPQRLERPARPHGALDVAALGQALAALQPEGAIVVDEAATSGFPYWLHSAGAAPSTYLGLTGGSIGQGLPCATGAALACPDRPVIAFQADGSALYTVQALWTQAREGLNVTTILCSNREYRILRLELGRVEGARSGAVARSLTSLREPDIDWVQLSRGLGVPAARAETADTLVAKLERALLEPGPHLIEAVLS